MPLLLSMEQELCVKTALQTVSLKHHSVTYTYDDFS